MFSLIITIISIALVAALALATLYYGGGAFNKGAAQANAAKVLLQGQQLLGAAELYKAENGDWPSTMGVLVTEKYLKSIPFALGPVSEALALGQAWAMPVARIPVFVLSDVEPGTCASVNVKTYGVEAILKTARTEYMSQCFGLTASTLKVVVGKANADLVQVATDPAATVSLGIVSGLAAPADLSSSDWLDLTAPTVDAPQGPVSVTITSSTTNYNLFTAQANPGTAKNYVVTVNPGVVVSALSTASPAFTTGALPAGSTVKIINNGLIQGKGGAGGSGYGPGAGYAGGPALQTTIALTLDNSSGYIFGGGGGGGGFMPSAAVGGSGGAGGGAGGSGDYSGSPGTSGISGGGGAAGYGYAGGAYGSEGPGGGTANPSVYGAGGAAGAAVVKGTNSVTWLGGNVAAQVKGAQ